MVSNGIELLTFSYKIVEMHFLTRKRCVVYAKITVNILVVSDPSSSHIFTFPSPFHTLNFISPSSLSFPVVNFFFRRFLREFIIYKAESTSGVFRPS